MGGYQNLFLNMAFMMIVLTVIATTIGVSIIERKRASSDGPDESEPKDEWASKSLTYRRAKDAHKSTDWERAAPIKRKHKPTIKQSPPPKQMPVIKQASLQKQSSPVRKHPQPAKRYVHAPTKDEHPLVKRAGAAKKTDPRKPDSRPKRQMKK